MPWFVASLWFKCLVANDPEEEALWEERLVLLDTQTITEAQAAAHAIGKAEEHQYVTADGVSASWRFDRLERIYEVQVATLGHGTELFSRYYRCEEARS